MLHSNNVQKMFITYRNGLPVPPMSTPLRRQCRMRQLGGQTKRAQAANLEMRYSNSSSYLRKLQLHPLKHLLHLILQPEIRPLNSQVVRLPGKHRTQRLEDLALRLVLPKQRQITQQRGQLNEGGTRHGRQEKQAPMCDVTGSLLVFPFEF